MKIIDEKGKLFGKLNIIDLIAIIIIAAVVIFAGVKLLGGSPATGEPPVIGNGTKPGNITYVVQVNGITPEIYDGIRDCLEAAGGKDQLMASGEMVAGYVTKVESIPHVNYISTQDGLSVTAVETGPNARCDLLFTIQASVPDVTTNLVGAQEVRIGKNHVVKTTNIELTGVVITLTDG